MQELLNALFIIFIYAANQAKPIHYSVRKYTNTSIEFHSWYVLSIDEWYLTITDGSRKTKVRTRLAVDGKMSPEFIKVLKDLLNKDFNSWITIDEKESKEVWDSSWDENENSEWSNSWSVEWVQLSNSWQPEWSWEDSSKENKRKIPGRAEQSKKRK